MYASVVFPFLTAHTLELNTLILSVCLIIMLLFAEQTMSAKADTASMCCALDCPGKGGLYSSLFAALELQCLLEV